MLVRRSAAAAVDWLDPDFFVYSDETDFCKRLGDAGMHTLYVPAARAVHHEQLRSDRGSGSRRSSSSTATATSTCASITAPPRRPRSAP